MNLVKSISIVKRALGHLRINATSYQTLWQHFILIVTFDVEHELRARPIKRTNVTFSSCLSVVASLMSMSATLKWRDEKAAHYNNSIATSWCFRREKKYKETFSDQSFFLWFFCVSNDSVGFSRARWCHYFLFAWGINEIKSKIQRPKKLDQLLLW